MLLVSVVGRVTVEKVRKKDNTGEVRKEVE
jgi:hypothetical protein